MTSFDFRSLLPSALPHLISVVVMFFAASMLFSPVVFDGKLLDQGDVKNNVGMSKEARDVQRRDGEVPHWTDSMFGGMPTTQIAGTDVGTAPQWIWLAVRKAMPMEVGFWHRTGSSLVAAHTMQVAPQCICASATAS